MLLNPIYPPEEIEKWIKQSCENINSISIINNTTNHNKKNQNINYNLCLSYIPRLEVLERKLDKKLNIKL